MALLARHIRVQARQRKASLAMVESLRSVPILKVVALRAIRAQLSLVGILMASGANGRKTEKRLLQILHLDQRS